MDLLSQFAKVTNDTKDTSNKETTAYGTVVVYDGLTYARLDGSDLLTPISTTTDVQNGERVTVLIKNHTATINGNITSPAANSNTITSALNTEVARVNMLIADKISTDELSAETARIETLIADKADITSLTAQRAEIDELIATKATIEQLNAEEIRVDNLLADKISTNTLSAQVGVINTLIATKATISDLVAERARITDLETTRLTADSADIRYANIDFTNIGSAAMEYFYANSGLINNVIINNGTITGSLVGVTITGDLIEGNTVVANKLVIQGEDGLYYKLNTDGVTIEADQTDYNSINGSIITAQSITATKINVSDLVAFDATIGGFNITESAIYSGVKTTPDNTTRGIYLDNDGQMAVGDANNFLKFYKNANDEYVLEISAESLAFGTNKQNLQNAFDDAASVSQSTSEELDNRLADAESAIMRLDDAFSTLVTDGNGTSLMTQTADGWTFDLSEIVSNLDVNSTEIDELTTSINANTDAVSNLQSNVADLGTMSSYIRITEEDDHPLIELGEEDSDYKVRIKNTGIELTSGVDAPAVIESDKMKIKNAYVEEELGFGGFVLKKRENGNVGLLWKGEDN